MAILTVGIAALLVSLTIIAHFAVLKRLANRFSRVDTSHSRPLLAMLFTLFGVHIIDVLLYALVFYAIALLDFGYLGSMVESGAAVPFADYFYFSIASYTTLGIGDIVPHGALRLLAGVEALNGLVLIAWSASFTYLMMERLWSDGLSSG